MHDFEYEAEYHPWCEGLWEALVPYFPLLPQIDVTSDLLPPMYMIRKVDVEESKSLGYQTYVISNNLIASKFSQTRQIIISGQFNITSGDTCCVYPENESSQVDRLMEIMNWNDDMIEIVPNPQSQLAPKNLSFPSPISIKNLLSKFIDLNKRASRYFI